MTRTNREVYQRPSSCERSEDVAQHTSRCRKACMIAIVQWVHSAKTNNTNTKANTCVGQCSQHTPEGFEPVQTPSADAVNGELREDTMSRTPAGNTVRRTHPVVKCPRHPVAPRARCTVRCGGGAGRFNLYVCCRSVMQHSQFARVAKGVDLRSTAGNCAWARTPQLTYGRCFTQQTQVAI